MAHLLSIRHQPDPHLPLQVLVASAESFAIRCRQSVTFRCASLTSVNRRLKKQSRVPEVASTSEKHFLAMSVSALFLD